MASVEDTDWRGELSLHERQRYMLVGKYASDVTLLVGEGEETVHAHWFVLVAGSAVFEELLSIARAKGETSLRVPDVTVEAIEETLKYLYCEEINLTSSNVLEILHAAKKFKVASLIRRCSDFLHSNVDDSNALTILDKSLEYNAASVAEKCMHIIGANAEQIVKSDSFLKISKTALGKILERDNLGSVTEMDLVEAVVKWAKSSCRRGNREPSDKDVREGLGDLVYLIRFASMSNTEFTLAMKQCKMLTSAERAEIYEFIGDGGLIEGASPPKRFSTKRMRPSKAGPQDNVDSFSRVKRFTAVVDHSWYYAVDRPDALEFAASKDIVVHGVGLNGGFERCDHDVQLKLLDADGETLADTSSLRISSDGSDASMNVCFQYGVVVKRQAFYTLYLQMNGPTTHRGIGGKKVVQSGDVAFTFSDSVYSKNGTDVSGGQFAEIFYTVE